MSKEVKQTEETKKYPSCIFLSSTFRDLESERKNLLSQIGEAFKAVGMEMFIPTGEPSQKIALDNILKCDIVIFLISPDYGSTINSCVYKEKCKANCGMKTGSEKISYTWCEYRFSLAEGKPHMVYILDEDNWPSKDSAPALWKFRNEIESGQFCKRIKREEVGSIIKDLVSNVVKWYSDNTLKLRNFCGRREQLKELFEKLGVGGSVEVSGVGGIGKTTLCELVLYLYKILGRKIVYIGREEAHASGTGYIGASNILNPQRFKKLSIDTVIDALGLPSEMKEENTESKINNILSKIENEEIILFIDNLQEDDDLKELIKRGNSLTNGSILVTSKKLLGITQSRLFLRSNEEPERLVEIMANRLSVPIDEDKVKKIKNIAEGHPIATYLLVSNLKRLGIETLRSFKEGLDFSRDEDVKEYMDRVIKSALSKKGYNFLKDVAIISHFNPIEVDILSEVFPEKEILGEIIDANIMKREGNKLLWEFNQIQEAVFEDTPERYRLAYQYYKKRFNKYKEKDDEIKLLICKCKIDYSPDIYKQLKDLYSSIKPAEPAYELLPNLAEEVSTHLEKEENKAEIFFMTGNIYEKLSNYKDKAENAKKAIESFNKALKVYKPDKYPIQYAITQNNLGAAYNTLAEVKDKVKNAKRAIEAFKEALRFRTPGKFPMQYATTQNNLGIAYKTLAEVKDKVKNAKRAIEAFKEALRFRTPGKFPMQYATTQNNLGNAYGILAEVKDKAENCRKAIKAYKEALKVYKPDRFPMQYAGTQNNLGNAYRTLAEVEDKAENAKKAIESFNKALKIFTKNKFPWLYSLIVSNLKKLSELCGDNS